MPNYRNEPNLKCHIKRILSRLNLDNSEFHKGLKLDPDHCSDTIYWTFRTNDIDLQHSLCPILLLCSSYKSDTIYWTCRTNDIDLQHSLWLRQEISSVKSLKKRNQRKMYSM